MNTFVTAQFLIFFYELYFDIRESLLKQAWATSGPRATYGPPNTLMWPASYIRSLLNSYIDYENILNIKKVPVLLQKQP